MVAIAWSWIALGSTRTWGARQLAGHHKIGVKRYVLFAIRCHNMRDICAVRQLTCTLDRRPRILCRDRRSYFRQRITGEVLRTRRHVAARSIAARSMITTTKTRRRIR